MGGARDTSAPHPSSLEGPTAEGTHTPDERDKRGTGQDGLSVLSLVGCSVNTKTCSNTAAKGDERQELQSAA